MDETREMNDGIIVKGSKKRAFYDIVFLIGFVFALLPGISSSLTPIAALGLIACITICFFDENFFIYMALFMYLRYRILLGDTPVYRLYSYMVVLKILFELPKMKFRISGFPALFVFFLHSIFATGRFESMRIGLNVIVDCVLVYVVLLKVMSDTRLVRKFIFAFLMGGIASGIYGWASDEYTTEINVSGAGAKKVARNFGALSDANFAGLFYSLCIISTIALKGIPVWMKMVFIALFSIMILQTASLSALLVLAVLGIFLIILKFRAKSIVILTAMFFGVAIGIAIILVVPPLREIPAIQGLIIRITEKLSYIPRGRWDLLTTDRYAIWQEALGIFGAKSLWGKLIGGSIVTVMVIDNSVFSIACHNSYLQSVLNFGIIGTLLIYIPFFAVFAHRVLKHYMKNAGYGNEDVKMLQLVFAFAFIVFGGTVDFFIDWPFMLFYFI